MRTYYLHRKSKEEIPAVLENFVLQESGFHVFDAIGNAIKSFKPESPETKFFSSNVPTVHLTSVKTIDALNRTSSTDSGNPIRQNEVPKDKESGERFLKKFHSFVTSKGLDVPYEEVHESHSRFRAAMIKLMEIAGLLGVAGAVSNPVLTKPTFSNGLLVGGEDVNFAGKFNGKILLGVISLSAVILTLIVILDAVKKSEQTGDKSKKISLKESFNNVFTGFKKMVTSLKIQKKETSFAFMIVILSAVANLVRKIPSGNYDKSVAISVTTKTGSVESVFRGIGEVIGKGLAHLGNFYSKIADAVKGKADDSVRYRVISAVVSNNDKDEESKATTLIRKHLPWDSATEGLREKEKTDAIEAAKKAAEKSGEKIASDSPHVKFSHAIPQKIDPIVIKKEGEVLGSLLLKYAKGVTVIACIVSILYYFTEMVDQFNKSKLKDDNDSENEKEPIRTF